MRIRVSLAKGLLIALVFSLIPFSAISAQKITPGSSCKVYKEKVGYKNKIYTCIKSGKKLRWDKGVTVVFQAPAATTAEASTKPAVTLIPEAGAACESVGSQLSNSAGYLECREIADGRRKYFQLSNNPVPPPMTDSPESLETCRAPDARTEKNPGVQAIAYPVTSARYPPAIPAIGKIKVAIIPIDFSDVPGTGSPSDLIDPEIVRINDWVKQFANGKMTYDIQTSKKWIRASKESSEYVWIHPGPEGLLLKNPLPGAKIGVLREPSQIAQDLMASAQDDFDYTNLKIVAFVYPKNIVNIWHAMTAFGGGIQTNKGIVNAQTNATGASLYQNHMPMWSWFIHENMHPHGLAGHAPSDGSPLNLMTNQDGLSLVLNAWDQLILDWQIPNQFYCISLNNLKRSEVILSPLERNEIGTKAIMVRLSSHEVLVIESRRRDHWSNGYPDYKGLPKGFYGLVVYKVDTSINRNRVQTGGFADFVKNTKVNHANFFTENTPNFDFNWMIYEGETLSTNGISISLTKSGDNDLVTFYRN